MKTFKEYIDESWGYDGLSAKCLYGIYTGNKVEHNYPNDPSDLSRVLQMLRLIPEHRRKSIIKECALYYDSRYWMVLYDNWDELMDIFSKEWDQEAAPKTYQYMGKLFDGVRGDERNNKNKRMSCF